MAGRLDAAAEGSAGLEHGDRDEHHQQLVARRRVPCGFIGKPGADQDGPHSAPVVRNALAGTTSEMEKTALLQNTPASIRPASPRSRRVPTTTSSAAPHTSSPAAPAADCAHAVDALGVPP